jgi:N-acetylglucosaminyldiphosphoundecaprenol N-acetyl-beta-D-mannosaminyltransferase
VRFYRKIPVRCLDEVPFCNTADLRRHSLLVAEASNVLDHGVREGDIELPISKTAHVAGIADNHFAVACVAFEPLIENRQPQAALREAHHRPELRSAADIEKPELARQAVDQLHEEREPAPAHSRRERPGVGVVREFPEHGLTRTLPLEHQWSRASHTRADTRFSAHNSGVAATRPRVNVLGVGISTINLDDAVRTVGEWIAAHDQHYVDVCTVHTVMECRRNARLRRLINESGLATPDGMPLVWLCRLHGHRNSGRVYGPDLMLALCDRGRANGLRHYFYGGAPGVAERLADRLQSRFPGLIVAGTCTPPFRPADAEEDRGVLDAINAASPDIVWVGLGTPKQDYWVARHRPLLTAPALIAIGAAFDFHAGLLAQAPRWMQQSGLEWAFRLAQEPRRLAFRYLVYNPRFIFETVLQLTGLRVYALD